jgi:aryl-alcohol dehydrogenase-like predicted oxidoreductase
MNLIRKIGLGSVQFGLDYGISNHSGKTPSSEVTNILRLAQQSGIAVIDTASAYGDAEKVLGQNDISPFKIVSKFMPPTAGQALSGQLDATLHNLKKDSVYGYLAHRPLELAETPALWQELQELKINKKVEKVGFSLNSTDELGTLLELQMIPDIVQVPYNYLDRRFETALKELKSNGCEIHTRSAFLQGLFFSDVSNLSEYFNDVKPLIEDLQQNEKHLSAALLHFVLTKEFIDIVIIGVENVKQLEDNLVHLNEQFNLPPISDVSEDILIPSRWPRN